METFIEHCCNYHYFILAYVDYVPIKEVRITFAFGQSVKSLNVTILQDNFLEGDEMFFLNLTATQEYSNHILLGSNPYTVVTIEDDDGKSNNLFVLMC